MTSAEVRADTTRLLFAGKRLLRGQARYLSDHVGLCTRLAWVQH